MQGHCKNDLRCIQRSHRIEGLKLRCLHSHWSSYSRTRIDNLEYRALSVGNCCFCSQDDQGKRTAKHLYLRTYTQFIFYQSQQPDHLSTWSFIPKCGRYQGRKDHGQRRFFVDLTQGNDWSAVPCARFYGKGHF